MSSLNKISFYQIFLSYFPITILFLSVFNEFDFNYLNIEYFSFNFVHILIFYWTLRNPDQLGYVSIFLAGLINDAIIGIPFGISSFCYLIKLFRHQFLVVIYFYFPFNTSQSAVLLRSLIDYPIQY